MMPVNQTICWDLEKLSIVFDFSRGALWKVSDDFWEEVIPRFVRKRKWHPGLSIGTRREAFTIRDKVSLLKGGSHPERGWNNFQITGFSSDNPKKKSFFVIRPAAIPLEGALKRGKGKPPLIQVNRDKPHLTEEELADFNRYLQEKGLHI